MAIETLDLGSFENKSDSVYEACLVIAKRARSINADRISKRKEKEILEESGYDAEIDPYDREFLESKEFEKETSPTVIAQEEFFSGKLKTIYVSDQQIEE